MKIKELAKRVRKALRAGFSLVEMLVVIAVIGVITAVAVPAISSITSEAEQAKLERNAQNIASVYNSAIAAGADTGVDALTVTDGEVGAAIDNLQTGVAGSGSFVNARFTVDITDDEQALVEPILTLANGIMTFN